MRPRRALTFFGRSDARWKSTFGFPSHRTSIFFTFPISPPLAVVESEKKWRYDEGCVLGGGAEGWWNEIEYDFVTRDDQPFFPAKIVAVRQRARYSALKNLALTHRQGVRHTEVEGYERRMWADRNKIIKNENCYHSSSDDIIQNARTRQNI